MSKPEKVNHPPHYGGDTYEAIKVIEAWDLGFCLGNAVKYIARAGRKTPDALEDLQKAAWYLNREIWRLAAEADVSIGLDSEDVAVAMDRVPLATNAKRAAKPVLGRHSDGAPRCPRCSSEMLWESLCGIRVYEDGHYRVQCSECGHRDLVPRGRSQVATIPHTSKSKRR